VTTDFVDLDEKPDKADLGAKTDDLPTWGKLVKGAEVPVVVARDGKGRERALVNRKLAVAAVEQLDAEKPAEKQILEAAKKAPSAPRLTPDEEKARVLAQKEQQEREARLGKAEIAAIVSAARLPLAKLGKEWFVVAAQTLVACVMEAKLPPIAARLGWKPDEDQMMSGNYTGLFFNRIVELEIPDILSLLTELLISSEAYDDIEHELASALGVDLRKVRKDEEAKMKAEAKFAAGKKKAAALVEWSPDPGGFEWNEAGVCSNPVVGKLALGKKIEASVKLARSGKGWVYGFSFSIGTFFASSPPSNTATHYDQRSLAERVALLALKDECEGHDMLAAEKIGEFLAGGKGK
jgi:hypothetical protein